MTNSKEILLQAKKQGIALGAFNAGNLEIVKAVVAAAKAKKSPIIIEASQGEIDHFGMENFLSVVKKLSQGLSSPILTNFDHGPGLEECQAAIEAGFDLVHFDGSQLPLEENLKITKILLQQAKEKGVLIEAEINPIANRSQVYSQDPKTVQSQHEYTDPQMAHDFVAETKVDLLAVFVGNLHGVYPSPPRLDLERLKLISQETDCFLSLHGGSGLSPDDIKMAIAVGKIVKININTELRVAFKETLSNVLKGSEELAVYKLMPPVEAAIQNAVEEKIDLFRQGALNQEEASDEI